MSLDSFLHKMRRGSFLGGFLAAAGLLVVAAVVAYFALDLRISVLSGGVSSPTELSKAEVKELGEGDWAILVFCTENRGPKALVKYTDAVSRLVGFARGKPEARTIINPIETVFTREVPTMQQRLIDYTDLIRRKCGEPRGLGNDAVWENDVEYLQEVAQQLMIEASG
jgi:hypothetical protein